MASPCGMPRSGCLPSNAGASPLGCFQAGASRALGAASPVTGCGLAPRRGPYALQLPRRRHAPTPISIVLRFRSNPPPRRLRVLSLGTPPPAVKSALQGLVPEWPAYAPWDKVQLGPLSCAPMGLGTWAWGNRFLWGYDPAMDGELQRVFDLVVGRGVDLFDTADSYGTGTLNGRSEELLGRFIREYPGSERARSNVKIATKLAAYPWRLTASQMVSALRGSLRRLGRQKLAIGQLHWSAANYAPLQERALWDGLVGMYEEGLVDCVGVSNYGPRQLERIFDYLQARNVPLASAQVQFSLLSFGPQQEALREFCESQNIRVIAYSPLGLGALSGKYSTSNLPPGPRSVLFKQMLPGLGPLLGLMTEIGAVHKKTVSQVAINWCICKGTIPIPGAKNLQQAEENLGALGWKLSAGEVAALEGLAKAVPRPMVQNIFQTK